MSKARETRAAFRRMVASAGPVVVPGAHDPRSARLVEAAGFAATYVGSYATSAAGHGLPDVGALTLTELAEHAHRVSRAVSVPVLADAEGGFFDAANMWRTVQAFQEAGVCGVHIEDHAGAKLLAGSDEVKAKYLPPVARGDAMFSYVLSEREAGSDSASMKTRAGRDGDDWILNGQKSWITNAGESEYYTILAVTDPEGRRGANVTAFVVERGDDGFSFGEPERKMGIKGSPTRELHLDNVRIPGDRIVGAPGEGLKLALRTLDHTRVTIGAQALGIAQGALDFAVGYVKERKQFGKRIADFQGIQFMLADMAMTVEAARQMVYAAAAKSERNDADLSFFGAAAKAYASDVAMQVTTDAVQLLGGYGYTRDFPPSV
jgi:alkylation response protein AidB-like acyl-CoA dehydrogenase